ncbi:putative sporulation protein YtxC [Phosphitispora fastidiosa]|uniref:putative sporulation protein YtxC n=1 Tax=Phosphitispora fastidiosa TaxID=2837202 RepID=UPI001E2C1C57|nr:putative sporulation protein YtxC [Phosphitispora fastidiosa]MBU7007105.1 putative sporulation protein YtxC [Phosphitispora fastidiosa]
MQASFSIGARENIEMLKSKLDTEFAMLQNDGIRVSLEESPPTGGLTFLGYNIADYGNSSYSEEETRSIFKHYIANVVSEIILNYWEKGLLKDIIKNNYYYFLPEEQQVIYDIALNHLNHGVEPDDDAFVHYLSRKALVLQKLIEYLHTNDRLIIEGFIRFRLKDYLQEIYTAADKAVDDFMLEKEYKEFIKLLKYFVEIQEPRLETVQVLALPSGYFKLLDGNNKNISSEYLDGFLIESGDSEINYEDLLISALITIAPSSVILHYKEHDSSSARATETIKSVFGDRVKFCDGCKICDKAGKIKGNRERKQ